MQESVSIPYRQSQNRQDGTRYIVSLLCFNSLQVVSKRRTLGGRIFLENSCFNSLQVVSKRNWYTGFLNKKIVSIPYRQSQNKQNAMMPRSFLLRSFNSLQVVSKHISKKWIGFICSSFNSLQVVSKHSCITSRLSIPYIMFQFLIGSLKTNRTDNVLVGHKMEFQFLIGSLKTQLLIDSGYILQTFQFLIGSLKTALDIASTYIDHCFNSLQVVSKHSSMIHPREVFKPFQFLIGSLKTTAHFRKQKPIFWSFNSLQVVSKLHSQSLAKKPKELFQFLIGSLKTLCRLLVYIRILHHGFNSLQVVSKRDNKRYFKITSYNVSIPYRQSQNKSPPSAIYSCGQWSFNSLQVVSKPLQGQGQSRECREFQFLIGSLKTPPEKDKPVPCIAWFQFLIGSLKTEV